MLEVNKYYGEIAQRVIQKLIEYDREHHTSFSYYLDRPRDTHVLAQCIQQAVEEYREERPR